MEKILISGIELEVIYGRQVLNMGGPILGSFSIASKLIASDCIIDNFVFDESKKLLFFVQFHEITKYYFYFTINFYKMDDGSIYEFSKEFDMVFIKQFISPTELEIFHAFHDQFLEKKDIFDMDKESFRPV